MPLRRLDGEVRYGLWVGGKRGQSTVANPNLFAFCVDGHDASDLKTPLRALLGSFLEPTHGSVLAS